MLDSVFRLTPSDRAASVTVKCKGCLSTSPGCGGSCIFMVTSMVILVVHAIYVLWFCFAQYIGAFDKFRL
jgi:hypothetical protein